MSTRFAVLCLLLTGLGACKNDIELNAPYKDVPVIYAFFDHNQNLTFDRKYSVQFIRIEKIYQNSEGVTSNEGALVTDSLYYKNLSVKIIRYLNGSYAGTFDTWKVAADSLPKDDGYFSNTGHILYGVMLPRDTIGPANNDVEYGLEVTNLDNGNKYSSRMAMVQDATIPKRHVDIKNDTAYKRSINFWYTTGKNAYIYDTYIRLKYVDSPDVATVHFIDYPVQKGFEANPGLPQQINLDGPPFFEFLKTNIPANKQVTRTRFAMEFLVYGGGAELKTLINVSKPNLSIVQKKPEFSNISGGLGIFSSRCLSIQPNIILEETTKLELGKALNRQ